MKIGSKLLIGFSINIVFLLIVTVVSNYYINTLKSDIDLLSNDTYKKIVWTNEILETKQKQTINIRSSLLTEDSQKQKEYIEATLKLDATIKESFDSLMSTFVIKEAIALLDKLSATEKSLFLTRENVIQDIQNGHKIEATDLLLGAYSNDINSYFNILDEINNLQQERFKTASINAEKNYNTSILVQIIATLIAISITIVLSIKTTKGITNPIEQAVVAANSIANGDMDVSLDTNAKDETGQLLNAMKSMSTTIHELTIELNQLAEAATLGRLDTRANENKFEGEYQNIIKGFNSTLDAVIGPLNITSEYVDKISKGNIPPKITDHYNGDFNDIKTNLNQCIDAISLLVDDTKMLTQAAEDGRLNTRANDSVHGGDFNAIVRGFNNTLDLVIGPLNVTAEYVDRISKGDIPPKITENYNGDFNEIKNNLNRCIDAINTLVADTKMLAKAAKEGRLDVRAEESGLTGDFQAIVLGFNDTLDAVINPLNLTAEYVDRISKGDIPPKITDHYNGDFNEIKNNLNQCIDAIKLLIFDMMGLTTAYSDGNLNYRINTNNHQGDYKTIMTGINNTLDSVVNPFKDVSGYFGRIAVGDIPEHIADEYKGDFHEIKLIINKGISSINLLVEDTATLAKAMADGDLSVRTDLSNHGGDFRKIIQGVNQAIDLVAIPTNEISSTMSILTTGDLTARIVNSYNGDFAKLKEDINHFADTLSNLILEITETVQNTASAALQISSSAESLAAASQEQSAQADEVANAVKAMSRTITENAMSASRTAEVATQNSSMASESGKVVRLTVDKMRDIAEVVRNSAKNIEQLGESSKEIGEIISVIDDIADQTNLLALNAAIEAARAGEQGRGFAVVADEVRKLAERTTDATKQIANMIKGIQNETQQAVVAMNRGTAEVQSGIELADKAGDSLKQILSSTEEVLDMVNQIASASEEQSATSEQISKNVIAISKVTNDATIRIEDVAKTSDDLAQLTEQLRALVMTFKISNSNHYSNSGHLLGNNRNNQLKPASF